MQLAAGFIVGCAIGYRVWLLIRFTIDELPFVIGSVGLIGAALPSFYGNRFWMAGSAFMPREPIPPRKARALSVSVGCAGAVFFGMTFVHHLTAVVSHHSVSRSGGVTVFLLIAAGIPGLLVLHALRHGSGFWVFGIIDRHDTPLLFWIHICLNSTAVLGALVGML